MATDVRENYRSITDLRMRIEELEALVPSTESALQASIDANEKAIADVAAKQTALDADVSALEARVTVLEAAPAPAASLASFFAYDATGNLVITGTPAQVVLDTNPRIDAGTYSLSAGVVTILEAGTYSIVGMVGYQITNTSGGTRGSVAAYLEAHTGFAWQAVSGVIGSSYHRETAGQATSVFNGIVTLAATNALRIMVDRRTGSANVDTIAGESCLAIARVA